MHSASSNLENSVRNFYVLVQICVLLYPSWRGSTTYVLTVFEINVDVFFEDTFFISVYIHCVQSTIQHGRDYDVNSIHMLKN